MVMFLKARVMNKNASGRVTKYSQLTSLHDRTRAADSEGRLLTAARSIETAAERARKMREIVDRQMAALATDADHWRAAATLAHVDAALITYPEIRADLLRIGRIYERIAVSAAHIHREHVNRRKKRSAA